MFFNSNLGMHVNIVCIAHDEYNLQSALYINTLHSV